MSLGVVSVSAGKELSSPTGNLVERNLRTRYVVALAISLLYVITFLILASALRVNFGFPLDDSYIHQTVARNLAYHHSLGFMVGQPSSGSTSLLWEFLQAENYKFLGGFNPVLYNLVISIVALAVIGATLFLLAREDGISWESSIVLAAAPALSGNFLWLGLIGMEHLLFVAFSLLAIHFWFRNAPARTSSAVITGLFCGLLVLTRPEAVVFAPLLILTSFLSKSERRPWKEYGIVTAVWLLLTSIVLITNFRTSGSPMPTTLKGRSWLYFHSTGGPHTLASVLRFLGSWVQRLPRQFSTQFVEQLNSPSQIARGPALFGVGLLLLICIGVYATLRLRPIRIKFLLVWGAIHFLTFVLTFPASGHGGRYQPIVLMMLFPMLFLGAFFLLHRVFQTPPKAAFGIVCFIMLIGGVASLRTWRRVTMVGIEHINGVHGAIGAWMRQNIPVTDRVAAFDIGRVSYEWGGQIVDLGGLVDPSYYHYLVNGQVPKYLHDRHIQYVLLPGVGTKDMGFTGTDNLQKVLEKCTDKKDWLLGFRYTIHATQCQELDSVQ